MCPQEDSSVASSASSGHGLAEFALCTEAFQPPLSVSGGSAGSYNENLSVSMYQTLSRRIEAMESGKKAAEIKMEISSQKIAELERRLMESTLAKGSGADDEVQHRLQLIEDQKERYRRQTDALRHQLLRLKKHVKPPEERHLIAVEHFRRQDPGSEATIVMSTLSIAEENENRSAMVRAACLGAPGDRSVPHGDALDSDQEASPSSSVSSGEAGSRRGFHFSYSNAAIKYVTARLPGPNRVRDKKIGGTEKSEESLLSKLLVFFTTSCSIKSLALANPAELAAAATKISAEFEPLKGNGYRKAVNYGAIDKPVNAVGYIACKTLTRAIHAGLLALDYSIRKDNLVQTSDVLTVTLDISTFNQYAQLGVVLHLTHIEEDGVDALGQQLHKVRLRAVCLNSLPVTDKLAKDVRKEDGSLHDKEVPSRLVMELAMSGHLWDVLRHPCAFWGMDRGSECAGSGLGPKWARMRKALLGRGGPLEQIYGTRESLHAVMGGEHSVFLRHIMQFLEVPDQLKQFPQRPLPSRPDTSKPVMSLPFKLRVVVRTSDKLNRTKTVVSETLESHPSRISTHQSALSAYPLIQDCASGCYCDKHMIDRGGVAWISLFRPILKKIMFCISETRKMGNHLKLQNNFERVAGLKNARPSEGLHVAAANALGSELRSLISRFPSKLPRQEQAVESRWNMVQTTVTEVDFKRKVLVLLFIIAFAEGTEQNKLESVDKVRSEQGFTDERKIRFPNPKIGRCFHILNSPVEILYMSVTSLVHVLAFQPLLAASAHRKEFGSSSMRGLGSLVRVVDLVLRKLLFQNITNKVRNFTNKFRILVSRLKQEKAIKALEGNNQESAQAERNGVSRVTATKEPHQGWFEVPKLGHRGLPTIECTGDAWVSASLERVPAGCEDPPALLHLYGLFYNPAMATAISRVIRTIGMVCRMKAAEKEGVLSPGHRDMYQGKQDSLLDRIRAAQFLVRLAAQSAADCIWKKAEDDVVDPLGHLAGIYDVLRVRLTLNAFELDPDEESHASFFIATDQAIASANVLLVQIKELLSAHGDTLHELVNEPLKSLIRDCMPDLEEFAAAREVDFKPRGTLVGPSRKWYPKPVMAIGNGRLAKLALMAGARPTNNNSVESRWSLLTYRYHAMVRNATAQYMSAIFRKQDFAATGYLSRLYESEHFVQIFAAARKFMRRNVDGYKAIYRNNLEESEQKYSQKHRAKDLYDESNIRDSEDKQNFKKRAKTPSKRAADTGRAMSRYDGEESSQASDTESESESSDSESISSKEENSESASDTDSLMSGRQLASGSDSHSHQANQDQQIDSGPSVGQSVENQEIGNSAGMDDPGLGAMDSDPSNLIDGGQQGVCELRGGPPRPEDSAGVGITDGHVESHCSSSAQDEDYSAKEKGSSMTGAHHNDDGTMSDSDASDLPDGYLAADSDDENEEMDGDLPHPFPNPKELTTEEAGKASRWKLDFIWHLLKTKKWRDTVVEARSEKLEKNKILYLTRMDGVKFPLVMGNNLFYVLYGDNGMELINVESLQFKVLDSEAGDMHRVTSRKQPIKQWCVKYSRCLCTKNAIDECDSKKDFMDSNHNGMRRPISLGSESLTKILKAQRDVDRLIFHKGDWPYETAAKYIVGFVGWDSMSHGQESESCMKDLLRNINTNLSKQTNLKIHDIGKIDWVYCGADFNEKRPR